MLILAAILSMNKQAQGNSDLHTMAIKADSVCRDHYGMSRERNCTVCVCVCAPPPPAFREASDTGDPRKITREPYC